MYLPLSARVDNIALGVPGVSCQDYKVLTSDTQDDPAIVGISAS